MKKFLILVFSILLFTPAVSQDIGSIFTDRPSQTDAVSLLPRKVFQIEAGYYWEQDDIAGNTNVLMDIPNIMLKYGLLDWLELRLGTSVKFREQENVGILTRDTEAGSIYFAPKFHILKPKGIIPRISATAYFHFPETGTGFANVNDGALSTRLLFENAIADNLSVAYSIGTDSDFNGNTNGFYTFMVSAGFGKLGVFAEFFSSIIDGAQNTAGLDGGVGFTLSDNLTVDLAVGVGLNSIATDVFLNTGIGYRIH